MKNSMIVMIVIGIVLSMNLFSDVVSEKAKKVEMLEKHVCTAECNHDEMKKECGPECTMACCAEKKVEGKHVCTDECEMAKKHVCTDECKLDEKTGICELAAMKVSCMSSMKHGESAKDEGCKPEACDQKVIKKDCNK